MVDSAKFGDDFLCTKCNSKLLVFGVHELVDLHVCPQGCCLIEYGPEDDIDHREVYKKFKFFENAVRSVRETSDTFVGRVGGDRFAIVGVDEAGKFRSNEEFVEWSNGAGKRLSMSCDSVCVSFMVGKSIVSHLFSAEEVYDVLLECLKKKVDG